MICPLFSKCLLQIHASLKNIRFNNSAGEEITFIENSERSATYDILNWILFPNRSFSHVKVGSLDTRAASRQVFIIHPDKIVWPTQVRTKRNTLGSMGELEH